MATALFSEWSSPKLLSEKSPNDLTTITLQIAIRLASLGRITQAVEILTLSNTYYPVDLHQVSRNGLYFAFDSINIWPAFVPAEQRTPEYLAEIDKDWARDGWGRPVQMWQLYEKPRPAVLGYDGDGLRRLLEAVESGETEFDRRFEGNEEWFIRLYPRFGIVLTALDVALSIGGREDDVDRLLGIVKADLDTYLPKVANSSRVMWGLLKTGILQPEGSTTEIDAEFDRLKSAIDQRIKNGAGSPFKEKTMEELVRIIDENTRRQEYEEGEDDFRCIRDQSQPNNISKNSILHHPASTEGIADLEKRLDTTLPDDYKEFLRITDGMNSVWNGVYHESFIASSSKAKYVEDIYGSIEIPCMLLRWEDLPNEFDIEWPPLDFKHIIQLNDGEFGDLECTWLVKPEMIKEAIEAFFERFEEEKDEARKKIVERVVVDKYGGLEQLRGIGWAVLRDEGEEGIFAWASFRDYMEELANISG